MANTFGQLFKITTWGESHGQAVGVSVDGCPLRLPLTEDDIQRELDRSQAWAERNFHAATRGRPGGDTFRRVRWADPGDANPR